MKMKYRRDPEVFFRAGRQPFSWWPVILAGLVIILGLGGSVVIQGLDSPVMALSYPLFKISATAQDNINNAQEFFRRQSSLLAANDALRLENSRLRENNLVLKEAVLTAQDLRLVQTIASGTPVRVLSRPSLSPYDTIIINRGSKDYPNLAAGQLVFSTGGVVLGEIHQVYSYSSRVSLFSSPGHKLEVEVGEEHITAVAEGHGGGNFRIVLPRGIEIKVGDRVIAPMIAGEVLGVVGEVETKPEEPFQTIYFKSPVNIYELIWVIIHGR